MDVSIKFFSVKITKKISTECGVTASPEVSVVQSVERKSVNGDVIARVLSFIILPHALSSLALFFSIVQMQGPLLPRMNIEA